MSTPSRAAERLSLTATGWKMGSQHYSNVLAVRRTSLDVENNLFLKLEDCLPYYTGVLDHGADISCG